MGYQEKIDHIHDNDYLDNMTHDISLGCIISRIDGNEITILLKDRIDNGLYGIL